MKKTAAYILTVCLILACAGCGSEKSNDKSQRLNISVEDLQADNENKEDTSTKEKTTKDRNTTPEETVMTEMDDNTTTQNENVTANTQTAISQEQVNVPETTEQINIQPDTTKQEQANTQQGATQTNNMAATGSTPLEQHGALHVDGVNLTDEHGQKMQLYGMSTHGLSWFPQYVNYEAFKTLRDDWNTNCVRLAMYTAEYNGYCTGGNKEELKQLINNGVSYATDLGMYVIIDWHILNDNDPNVYKSEAKAFFSEMSLKYADSKNIIYEICNEPNGWSTWDSIKEYADEIIPVIRANDPDAVIIVGTPTWSQDIDKALAAPLNYDNVMYALHFYAATHTEWLRNRVSQCINGGLPVFISEFGICDASGNGNIDYNQASEWMSLIKQYNLSYCCWNLANKSETSSVIGSWCNKTSGWEDGDLSESGKWIKNQFKNEN